MLHHSFSDFTLIHTLVASEISGAPKASVLEAAAVVFSEFCDKTHAFKEEISMTVEAGVTEYDLVSPHEDAIIIGIAEMVLDGKELKPGDYLSNAPSRFKLVDESTGAGSLTVNVILKTKLTSTSAPTELLERWGDIIATGVKARMMRMPNREWSSPQDANFYRSEYAKSLLMVNSDVRNEFSVSRKGRSNFTYSVYGE